MTKLLPVLVAVVVALWAAPAIAQQGGRTCQYDLECRAGEACNEAGACVARGSLSTTYAPAGDECGTDRRCRINRLKRRNQADRHARTLREEKNVERMLDEEHDRALAELPRQKNPFAFGLRVSRIGAIGAYAGYSFLGRIQPSFEVTYSPDLYIWSSDSNSSGRLEAWWLRGGASYFLLDSWFSPYLSAGFQLGVGEYYNYNYDFGFDFGGFGNRMKSIFHAGEFGGGFDMQFKFGLHTRLGVVYRPLIYNQARIGPGQYDPLSRQGLADWYKRGAAVDVIWLLGWAI